MIISKTAQITILILIFLETLFLVLSNPITGYPIFEPTADYAVIEQKYIMSNSDSDMTFFGDSSTLFGISPEEMNTPAFERNILNLGTIASFGISGYYELLEQHLSKRKTNHVILALLPQTLELTKKTIADYKKYSAFLCATRGAEAWLSNRFKDCLIWLRAKHQFNIFPTSFGGNYKTFKSQIIKTSGHIKETHQYKPTKYIHTSFQASNYSKLFLKKFIELAKKKNVSVSIIFNPKPRSSISDSYTQDVKIFIQNLKKDHPELLVLEQLPLSMHDKYFATETHLNPAGARLHSRRIADAFEKSIMQQSTQPTIIN